MQFKQKYIDASVLEHKYYKASKRRLFERTILFYDVNSQLCQT